MPAPAGRSSAARTRYPSLENRPALVTGGAQGIGRAIALGLRHSGAKVAVIDIDRSAGEALVAETGGEILFVPADLTDVAALRAAVDHVTDRLGAVRALVNNAAVDQRHTWEDLTPEQWDDSQAVNIRHQFFVTQAVAPGMRAAGGGTVVNLASTASFWGAASLIPYTTAKAAVLGLTRSLAAALGEHDIRVNAVAPGAVMNERQMRLWYTPERREEMIAAQTLHSAITEDDIADAVLFLSADDSRMITKQCLIIDGGSR